MTNDSLKSLTFRNGIKVDVGAKPATKLLISPRVGFNWDVMSNKKRRFVVASVFLPDRLLSFGLVTRREIMVYNSGHSPMATVQPPIFLFLQIPTRSDLDRDYFRRVIILQLPIKTFAILKILKQAWASIKSFQKTGLLRLKERIIKMLMPSISKILIFLTQAQHLPEQTQEYGTAVHRSTRALVAHLSQIRI